MVTALSVDDDRFTQLCSAIAGLLELTASDDLAQLERRFVEAYARGYRLVLSGQQDVYEGLAGYTVMTDLARGRYLLVQEWAVRPEAEAARAELLSHLQAVVSSNECGEVICSVSEWPGR